MLLCVVIALYALVDNKAAIGRAEFEEGGELEKRDYESCVPWAWFQQCHEAGTFGKVNQTVM